MVHKILKKARGGEELGNTDVLALFKTGPGEDLAHIMETAFEIREEQGKHITLTSTIHITNQCRVTPKCAYCGFAAGTSPIGYYHPFFKTDDEIREIARVIEEAGIPRVSCSGAHGYRGAQAVKAAQIVKENTSLEVLVNVGTDLNPRTLKQLAHCGTDTVCCNLETTNEHLFREVKPGETLSQRIRTCEMIAENGLELSSGLLIGLGESYRDRVNHLNTLRRFKTLGEIPIMGFNPYPGTPMENHPACPLEEQMKTVAIARILFPELRITVPTPTIGPENIRLSLLAGADNIATVIPDNYPLEIKGVGSPGFGNLNRVLEVIAGMGLQPEMHRPVAPRKAETASPVHE